jgi:KDO2-lipid IV(A) lauroyltransferase
VRLRHRAEHFLFRRLLDGLAARPVAEAVERGARLGRLWHALDGGHRRLAERNIRAALGYGPDAAARTARLCFEHLGRTLAEFALAGRRIDELLGGYTLEGGEILREAHRAGRGVLILTAHCGNWELLGARLAREVPGWSVARKMSNPLVSAAIEASRLAAGVRTVEARNASRAILRAFGRGEAVGVLIDQSALRGERVFVEFFGRPAATNFGPAMLALRSGATVVPVFASRGADGRHTAVVGAPIEPAGGADRMERIGRTTARFTAAVEDFVRAHPEQWFWVHNRWKRRPEAGEAGWSPCGSALASKAVTRLSLARQDVRFHEQVICPVGCIPGRGNPGTQATFRLLVGIRTPWSV